MPQLNEKVIAALPAPAKGNKVHYFTDAVLGGVTAPPGFGVCVTEAGVKSFVLGYRHQGTKRRLVIGRWPTWTSLLAIKEARELRRRIDKGEDPLSARRQEKAAQENLFKNVCAEWFKLAGSKLRTGEARLGDLERLVFPWLGTKPIEAIKRSDIIRMLDRVAVENGEVMADRTLAYVGRILSWHSSRSDEYVSPLAKVRGLARTSQKERARKRILNDTELQAVWKTAEASNDTFSRLVRFILLTAARRSEAAEMTWDEIADGVWTLPASRSKTKQDVVRPLSPEAIACLPPKGSSRYVFKAKRANVPISGFTELRRAFYLASNTDPTWHIHDLRSTSKSLMVRAGVKPHISERCLGHEMPVIEGTYDQYDYKPEKLEAFQALAALVSRIANPVSNVVALHG
jgi:integrase